MKDILEHIKKSFNNKIGIQEKRPDIYQLFLPIYHEDGDMLEIYVEQTETNTYRLCDYGMTLMRLSYSYEIDTANKEAILQRVLSENHLSEDNGNIYFITKLDSLYSDILHVCQAYMKIGSMRYFKREVIESLFYEMLDEFIMSELTEYKPSKNVLPLPNRDDIEADYEFVPNGHSVYLFGVKDSPKARLTAISCLEFEKANLNFRSLVVHNDFDKLSKKDRDRKSVV